MKHIAVALMYAEIELQFHQVQDDSEMGCINNGNIQLNELAPMLYTFFGVNSKDCYRFYTDIKRRKNDSRTYFLDKMQMKLNEKMRRDDELERMRR